MTNNININLDSKHAVQAVAIHAGANAFTKLAIWFGTPLLLLSLWIALITVSPEAVKMRREKQWAKQCQLNSLHLYGELRTASCKQLARLQN
jgi:hypothetical protein